MNSLVFAQNSRVNRQWVNAAVEDINDSLSAVIDAVSWGCFNDSVLSAMKLSSPLSSSQTLSILDTQKIASAYMTASPAWDDLNKIIFFNEEGIFFEYTKNRYGALEDYQLLIERMESTDISFSPGSYVCLSLGTTLNSPYEDALLAYGRMNSADAYIYAELDMSIFDPVFSDASVDNIYLRNSRTGKMYPSDINAGLLDSSQYLEESFSLLIPDVEVVYFEDRNPMTVGSVYGLSMFIILLAGSTLLVLVVSFITSKYLTRSTTRLVRYMKDLAENEDYGSVDPSIEEGDDEIANIGKSVNAMSLSIAHLLESNEKLYDEKRETELSMLQMQVNPHFLYNTLEVIRMSAIDDGNTHTAEMIEALSEQIHYLIGPVKDFVPLSHEINIVRKYIFLLNCRVEGAIEFKAPDDTEDIIVPKLILQPLVENAYIHGLKPKGSKGCIEIDVQRKEDTAEITVMDNGVGIDKAGLERIDAIFRSSEIGIKDEYEWKSIGLKNVYDRIKLIYGDEYSLSVDSVPGVGTVFTIRIPYRGGYDGTPGDSR